MSKPGVIRMQRCHCAQTERHLLQFCWFTLNVQQTSFNFTKCPNAERLIQGCVKFTARVSESLNNACSIYLKYHWRYINTKSVILTPEVLFCAQNIKVYFFLRLTPQRVIKAAG